MEIIKEVPLIKFNAIGSNGCVYPKAVFEEALKECIEENNGVIFGQTNQETNDTLELGNISHKIDNIKIEDDYAIGDVTLLDTPKGKTMQETFHSGSPIYLAPQGYALVNQDKEVTDFSLISINFTNNPLFSDCQL